MTDIYLRTSNYLTQLNFDAVINDILNTDFLIETPELLIINNSSYQFTIYYCRTGVVYVIYYCTGNRGLKLRCYK